MLLFFFLHANIVNYTEDTTDSIYKVYRNIIWKQSMIVCFAIQYIYIDRGSCLNYTYLLASYYRLFWPVWIHEARKWHPWRASELFCTWFLKVFIRNQRTLESNSVLKGLSLFEKKRGEEEKNKKIKKSKKKKSNSHKKEVVLYLLSIDKAFKMFVL